MQRSSLRLRTLGTLAGTFALAMFGTGSAGAAQIAQYFQTSGVDQWSISTTGTTTSISASGSVLFLFDVGGTPFVGPVASTFTLTATSSTLGNCATNCGSGDAFTQAGYSGNFEFTDTATSQDLLSGTFTVSSVGATLTSTIGGSGGTFEASATAANPNQLVLASAFLNFSGQSSEDATFSLSNLTPAFSITEGPVDQGYPTSGTTFSAAGSGTISSVPGPSTGSPEPATLTLIGGGLVGIGLLRRRKRLSVR